MEQKNQSLEFDEPAAIRHGGNLSAARSALHVLALLESRPEGVRAEEVASAIGKSISTAYYLLKALCEEGFAVHDQHRGVYGASVHRAQADGGVTAPAPDGERRELSLAALADELFARTHKRSYVGVLRSGAVEIVEVRGRQGLPRQPGLGDKISDSAHATAMGKVILSLMRPAAVERYLSRELRILAAATIDDPDVLREQFAEARRRGFAVEVEELAEDFCCIAAPVFGEDGTLRAVIGISMSRHAFEASLEVLARAVREVAGTKLVGPRKVVVHTDSPSTLEKSGVS